MFFLPNAKNAKKVVMRQNYIIICIDKIGIDASWTRLIIVNNFTYIYIYTPGINSIFINTIMTCDSYRTHIMQLLCVCGYYIVSRTHCKLNVTLYVMTRRCDK